MLRAFVDQPLCNCASERTHATGNEIGSLVADFDTRRIATFDRHQSRHVAGGAAECNLVFHVAHEDALQHLIRLGLVRAVKIDQPAPYVALFELRHAAKAPHR